MDKISTFVTSIFSRNQFPFLASYEIGVPYTLLFFPPALNNTAIRDL